MKKTISMVSALIHMMTRPAAKKENDQMIFIESLPTAAKFFVQHHFSNRCISFAEKKTNCNGTMYIATLNDGTQIGFNENGSWEMIDCKMGAVPSTLVPETVSAFMNAYYPNIPLVKIEKINNGYLGTLSNFASLKFTQTENVA